MRLLGLHTWARAEITAGPGIVLGEGIYPSVYNRRRSCFGEVMLIGDGSPLLLSFPPCNPARLTYKPKPAVVLGAMLERVEIRLRPNLSKALSTLMMHANHGNCP